MAIILDPTGGIDLTLDQEQEVPEEARAVFTFRPILEKDVLEFASYDTATKILREFMVGWRNLSLRGEGEAPFDPALIEKFPFQLATELSKKFIRANGLAPLENDEVEVAAFEEAEKN